MHRDLKPGNIILADDGPRIMDFGIAHPLDATSALTATGRLIGTYRYMSPEQVGAQRVGPASDVSAAGATATLESTVLPRQLTGGDPLVTLRHPGSMPQYGAAGRFHRWQFDGGTVTLVPLGIRKHTQQEISAAIEGKQLKRHRLDRYNRRHRAILHTRWQCRNTLCPEAAHWQGQLLVWPLVTDHGQARCPTCDEPLNDLGPRERLHEIVVEERSGAEIMRFPLEAGSPVIVGRGLTLKGVNLQVYGLSASAAEAVEAVSRRHLTLRLEEPAPDRRRMVVIDLGSRNGTVVEHPPGAGKPTIARPGKETHVMEKDLVVLGDVTLRFSGKEYVADGSQPPYSPPPADNADSWQTCAVPKPVHSR